MSKEKGIVVEIPSDILEKLDAMPDRVNCGRAIPWQPWEDEVIRKYYGVKSQINLARLFHRSPKAVGDRARELGV